MALVNDIATKDQATSLIRKTKELLYESNLGGYKLNTKYEENKFFGRAFYFSYNHKENGAVFSHMVMMYAFGLYNYGYVKEGRQAVMNLLELSLDKKSKVYRGIPEYFNDKGEGKYSYLTGSASWLIYLIRNQIFGIKFKNGNLFLEPKLDSEDFIDSKAIINTVIFGKKVEITYQNENLIPYNEYKIGSIFSEGKKLSLPIKKGYNKILVRLVKK
jgi:cellobiose phosphorylase